MYISLTSVQIRLLLWILIFQEDTNYLEFKLHIKCTCKISLTLEI